MKDVKEVITMAKKRGRPAKKVRVIELNEVYTSVSAAAKAVNGQPTGISKVLSGDRKKHMGYTFEEVA